LRGYALEAAVWAAAYGAAFASNILEREGSIAQNVDMAAAIAKNIADAAVAELRKT
jgi:hypothetical protein